MRQWLEAQLNWIGGDLCHLPEDAFAREEVHERDCRALLRDLGGDQRQAFAAGSSSVPDAIVAVYRRLPQRSQFRRPSGLLLGAILAPTRFLPARHCCRLSDLKEREPDQGTARQRRHQRSSKATTDVRAEQAMPSKKKARGRKNCAKKEATRTADLRGQWEPTIITTANNSGAISCCEHMLAVSPKIPQEGTAVSFMNHMAGEGFFDRTALFQKEDNERALAIDLLLRFTRNASVRDSAIEGENWFHNQPTKNEKAVCCMINLLELVGTYSDFNVAMQRAAKTGNKLTGGNRRDLVKFAAKRLPCTCLKKLHRAARKKVEKVGLCFGCRNKFPRSELFVCTGCRSDVQPQVNLDFNSL
ncbi:hypothetical protein THAOC_17888 [Thalassiosira oceanica]|uniref:Uncharacterized protein n=1 Tax=Thalassiosira oceanica TaxID=159749 RepID=K0STI9_THAOC|nr:hypothetical protein THAOC_17888 [Thalassiosira oceanica]|eukprot:EJK61597.1 hypothetical protein THAOC_17888 [Thalassiosira oceanica]